MNNIYKKIFSTVTLILLTMSYSYFGDTSNIYKKEQVVMESLKKFYDQKRVLVTGGAGFIGSHIVEKLVSLGAKVTILDNFSTGLLSNIQSVVHAVNIFHADVRSAHSCLRATANQDIVFHLAAFISVPESITNPDLCYNINIDGTKNMLEACIKNNVKTFVLSSSSAVYGNKEGICAETDQLDPQSPYGISKQKGESLCKEYAKSGLNTVILRYFNVYGERQNPNGQYAAVVAKFTDLLKAGKPLTIFGDGKQTRDFVHVSNVANANIIIAAKERISGEIFNIGTGTSINLLDLIEKLEQELNTKKTDLLFQPARKGDIVNSQANCQKYQQIILDW
jgi:UDP-glucose 4-epimerase